MAVLGVIVKRWIPVLLTIQVRLENVEAKVAVIVRRRQRHDKRRNWGRPGFCFDFLDGTGTAARFAAPSPPGPRQGIRVSPLQR